MIDHAPRILAQARQAAQQEQDQLAITELERRSAPLLWCTFVAIIVLSIATLADATSDHFGHDQDTERTNAIFAQCLNGKAIKLGDSILHCEVHHYDLVAGVQP